MLNAIKSLFSRFLRKPEKKKLGLIDRDLRENKNSCVSWRQCVVDPMAIRPRQFALIKQVKGRKTVSKVVRLRAQPFKQFAEAQKDRPEILCLPPVAESLVIQGRFK